MASFQEESSKVTNRRAFVQAGARVGIGSMAVLAESNRHLRRKLAPAPIR